VSACLEEVRNEWAETWLGTKGMGSVVVVVVAVRVWEDGIVSGRILVGITTAGVANDALFIGGTTDEGGTSGGGCKGGDIPKGASLEDSVVVVVWWFKPEIGVAVVVEGSPAAMPDASSFWAAKTVRLVNTLGGKLIPSRDANVANCDTNCLALLLCCGCGCGFVWLFVLWYVALVVDVSVEGPLLLSAGGKDVDEDGTDGTASGAWAKADDVSEDEGMSDQGSTDGSRSEDGMAARNKEGGVGGRPVPKGRGDGGRLMLPIKFKVSVCSDRNCANEHVETDDDVLFDADTSIVDPAMRPASPSDMS
jgi:hypothetical protein